MKFTIFTGFYEFLDTFDDLVEGVFSQTYTNWEWLVSDDFSSNPEVCQKLEQLAQSSHKVKIVEPSFKKQFYWNPPVEYALGDIFMVCDSDDKMHPRLLEVYKHNFEKFPQVQLISCNSAIFNDTVRGSLRATRHINYGKNCNSYQSYKDLSYEYNWGDCRAWRNNIAKFCEDDTWKYCAEDALKITVAEEKGKILYIPRVLCSYAHRRDSISHEPRKEKTLFSETDQIFEEAHLRKNRDLLNSIEDYYDRAFDQTTAFYLSHFNFHTDPGRVHLFSPRISPREIEILKNLYFDIDLRFNVAEEHCEYLIAYVSTDGDLPLLEKRLSSHLPLRHLAVHAEKQFREGVDEILQRLNMGYSWLLYTHYNTFTRFL
jgi:glycosyltransferase involved in cell wall biosynthesis